MRQIGPRNVMLQEHAAFAASPQDPTISSAFARNTSRVTTPSKTSHIEPSSGLLNGLSAEGREVRGMLCGPLRADERVNYCWAVSEVCSVGRDVLTM